MTTAPPGLSPPSAPPPPRSWASRNLVWIIVGSVLVTVVLCGGCLGVGIWQLMGVFRNHPAAKTAVAQAQADPRVTAITGTPLEAGRFLSAQFSATAGKTTVSMDIPVSGPAGSGWLRINAVQTGPAGAWSFNRLVFEPKGGQPIDINMPPPLPPEVAPSPAESPPGGS